MNVPVVNRLLDLKRQRNLPMKIRYNESLITVRLNNGLMVIRSQKSYIDVPHDLFNVDIYRDGCIDRFRLRGLAALMSYVVKYFVCATDAFLWADT